MEFGCYCVHSRNWFSCIPCCSLVVQSGHAGRIIEGIVMEIGWYRTLIRSFEREVYVVPNSVFSRTVVLNVTRKGKEWRVFECVGIRVEDMDAVPNIISDMRITIRRVRRQSELHSDVCICAAVSSLILLEMHIVPLACALLQISVLHAGVLVDNDNLSFLAEVVAMCRTRASCRSCTAASSWTACARTSLSSTSRSTSRPRIATHSWRRSRKSSSSCTKRASATARSSRPTGGRRASCAAAAAGRCT
jgi:Mechanosensitive ion channel